jgi:hypothetical protein
VSNTWGVYTLAGVLAFDVDTMVDLSYDSKAKVSNFPVEQGGFTSYNKVQEPFTIPIQLAVSSAPKIKALITALETARTNPTLFNVVTPMRTYLSVTLTTVKFSQSAKSGIDCLIVKVGFEQIRQIQAGATDITLPPPPVDPTLAAKQTEGQQQTIPIARVTQGNITAVKNAIEAGGLRGTTP